MSGQVRPSRVVVDLDAVAGNVARLGEVAGTEVCAVVKADGYGHGAVPVARAALAGGARWLAVALVEEGRRLRGAGVDAPTLLLAEPPPDAADSVVAARLTPMVYTTRFLDALEAAAAARRTRVDVHVHADTGMGRVGAVERDWEAVLRRAHEARHLRVDGLSTHLARADEPDRPETAAQLEAFDRFVALADGVGVEPRWVHAANTAGTLLHPGARRSLVRPGIGIYGLSPDLAVDAADHGLAPALSLVSEVSFVKHVPAGTPVSYGHRFVTPEDGWLATVPLGYADGIPRRLTGVGQVLLGGVRRPIAGTITMDQFVVWCGPHRPTPGDEVVLLGGQGDERLRMEEWAAHLGTITYEPPTQLAARLPRVHVGCT